MVKKKSKKKTSQASPKKKAATGKTKKVVKKTAKKSPAKKSAAAKSPVKKTTTKTAKPTKTSTVVKTTKVKNKAAATKATTSKKAPSTPAKKTTTPASPQGNNGKAEKTVIAKTPTPIRRRGRSTPPPPPEPVVEDWTPLSNAKLRKIKSGLSRKDLNGFKRLLLEKRAEIVGDVTTMEQVRNTGNGGELSNMPLHMADVGSDNYEQEFTLGLVESERKLLTEIDAALIRIQNKIYGVCIITGNPIPTARLEIKPWAKYSIEVVREREKHGLHSF